MTINTIRHETVDNKELLVIELDGLYNILAYEDGKPIGSYTTRDKDDAIDVYQLNLESMFK